jgi:hypothetical protein
MKHCLSQEGKNIHWGCLETSALDSYEEEHEGVAIRCRKLRNSKSNNFYFSCNIVRTPVTQAWRSIWWCDARVMEMHSRFSVLDTLLKTAEFIKD